MGSSTSRSESDLEIQRRLAAAVKAYAERVLEGGDLPPFPEDHDVSQTAVAISAAAMLKMVQVYSFELAVMFDV
ncbi:MAG TPA: hypothetical protein VFD49_03790 [Candidatus Dormibacteraeota bacterium]|nr:hypothetical protein [Candidatus Dormibacteraeota bacterium]